MAYCENSGCSLGTMLRHGSLERHLYCINIVPKPDSALHLFQMRATRFGIYSESLGERKSPLLLVVEVCRYIGYLASQKHHACCSLWHRDSEGLALRSKGARPREAAVQ